MINQSYGTQTHEANLGRLSVYTVYRWLDDDVKHMKCFNSFRRKKTKKNTEFLIFYLRNVWKITVETFKFLCVTIRFVCASKMKIKKKKKVKIIIMFLCLVLFAHGFMPCYKCLFTSCKHWQFECSARNMNNFFFSL